MLVGVIGKLMKSISSALHKEENKVNVIKNLLDKEWFYLNDKQLQLYKKLYRIIFEINNDWYKIYSGNYSDDLICFLGLLEYMNHFKSAEDIKKILKCIQNIAILVYAVVLKSILSKCIINYRLNL